MILKWMGEKVTHGSDWEVDYVRFHTVKAMAHPDGIRRDTMVMYVSCTPDQLHKIIRDNPPGCIPLDVLGISVFPLIPNAVFWTWKYPGLEDMPMTRFEIVEKKVKPDVVNSIEDRQADQEAKLLECAGPGEERDMEAHPVPQAELPFDVGIGNVHAPRDTD